MSKLAFRGSRIRYVDIRRDKEAGVFVRLHVTAEMSTPIIRAMGWADAGTEHSDSSEIMRKWFPESAEQMKLSGALMSQHMVLTPTDKALQQHEIQCEVSEVSDFQAFRVKDGDSTKIELRFIARSIEPGSEAKAATYLRIVGEASATMSVTYSEQSQESLELGDAGGRKGRANGKASVEQQATLYCVACENKIPLAIGRPGYHDSGAKCTLAKAAEPTAEVAQAEQQAGPSEPALAPARVMGGTHQKGTKQRRAPRDPEREAFADGSGPDPEEVAQEVVQ